MAAPCQRALEEIAQFGAQSENSIALDAGYIRSSIGCNQVSFPNSTPDWKPLSAHVNTLFISDQFWIQIVYSIPCISESGRCDDNARAFLIPFSDVAGTKVMEKSDFLRGTNQPIRRWRCGQLNDTHFKTNVQKQYLPSTCNEFIRPRP